METKPGIARPSRPSSRPSRLRLGLLVALAAAPLVLGACSPSDGASGTAPAESATITVMAAASLTEPFTELAATFEAEHPGVTVNLVFDGSSTLATQLVEGAPADVFASASQATMTEVTDAGLITDPENFIGNQLTIAVPSDNPAGITSLEDLVKPGVAVVVCAPEVPCGALAVAVLDAAGLDLTPVSQEQNVKGVVTKLTTGDADAGFVYLSDVQAEGDALKTIALPDTKVATTNYYIGVLDGSSHTDLARQFLALVSSAPGQQVLHDAGFSDAQS
ncbi:MAG: molybdate ABC transporter substrate-binding protein [Micrococcales bacterium]|nr:molybdate ABC transporter substrate-binding protein [Micrococcales bacterium]